MYEHNNAFRMCKPTSLKFQISGKARQIKQITILERR